MKKLLLGLSLLAVFAVGVVWTRSASGRFFAGPSECVEAYYRTLKDADERGFRECLADELRRHYAERGPLAADLQARGRDLRGWVVFAAESAPEGMSVVVEEQYSAGRRRQKLLLARVGSSWRVARIEAAQDLPQDIPYGTHISQVDAEKGAEEP
jgi:hypothetical protein